MEKGEATPSSPSSPDSSPGLPALVGPAAVLVRVEHQPEALLALAALELHDDHYLVLVLLAFLVLALNLHL